MIDVENEVFSTVAAALRSTYSGIFVSGECVAAPPAFPAVTLVEDDNSTYSFTLDSSGTENHAILLYTANVYSNLTSGRKSQCRKIMSTIDTQMQDMGFIRVGSVPMEMPNKDSGIYRMVARYRAVISKDKITFRR